MTIKIKAESNRTGNSAIYLNKNLLTDNMAKKRLRLSRTAIEVLRRRYLLKDRNGKIIETPEAMFQRVAKNIAKADRRYRRNPKKAEKEFFDIMYNRDFLPNSPTLMNAGTKLGQLSACFVLPIEDSMQSIFDALKNMAIIHQSGGGTGFSFSRIRPEGSMISTSKGHASGPVSFMSIFDRATDVIKQGGKRRGANIGILRIDHPDIIRFIEAKKDNSFANFNLSVGITDKFMDAVKKNKSFGLINPSTKRIEKKVSARKLFNLIVKNAWESGDPGVIFLDEINRKNPLKLGKIEATNPCSEVPLYPNESCTLGSINLANMVNEKEKGIEWGKLGRTVHSSVHFLDNVIDANRFPLPEIEKAAKQNRKIGLGVMGFADMLIKLNVSYGSETAIRIAECVMHFIDDEARKESEMLGKQRGNFPNFRKSALCRKYRHMRNATVTAIAPTGTISIIAGVSSSIEPIFAVKISRRILGGKKFTEIHPLYSAYSGSRKKLFMTAINVKPEQHIKIQSAFQKYTDNAVSKTVNLKKNATQDDVRKIFMLAYESGCKGITVYRQGSKQEQVMTACRRCR